MNASKIAEVMLRCNDVALVQDVIAAKVQQSNGKPDLPTFELLVELAAMRPDAFALEVKE